jgi:hypothetical protein
LRFLFLWLALYVLAHTFGLALAVWAGAIFGLTLRGDYWSNSVELLAASLVASSIALGWPWYYGAIPGLVLGLGRETLPLLSLILTPFSAVFGFCAAASQWAAGRLHRPDPRWLFRKEELQHGKSQASWNWEVLRRGGPILRFHAATYLSIAALSFLAQPLLTLALVGVTLIYSRIDEPRVLTMLIPFSAETLCKLM